jgi:hypothetical protein
MVECANTLRNAQARDPRFTAALQRIGAGGGDIGPGRDPKIIFIRRATLEKRAPRILMRRTIPLPACSCSALSASP